MQTTTHDSGTAMDVCKCKDIWEFYNISYKVVQKGPVRILTDFQYKSWPVTKVIQILHLFSNVFCVCVGGGIVG